MPSVWSPERRSPTTSRGAGDHRTPFEHDHDRLLFSTPVRRLADKTQVFPLDRNDAVRTRLTHSHEVANLARSMGMRLIKEGVELRGLPDARTIPAILGATGLAHDLGNPPFGHQGEAAIGNWFAKSGDDIFNGSGIEGHGDVPDRLKPEFLEFEGNAQSIRILTRLQVAVGGFGLDLTAATLAALMKYPVPCDKRSKDRASTKKYGYFESETELVRWIRTHTGLDESERHPLTWIMEAADDLAYSVLDIEDAIRKGIVSPDDVFAIVKHALPSEYDSMTNFLEQRFALTRKGGFSIPAAREIMSSYLRTSFIDRLMDEAVGDFKKLKSEIENYTLKRPLMADSSLLICLKRVAQQHVFVSPQVRRIEADGFNIIGGLMDFYWHAIVRRADRDDLNSRRLDARAAFGIAKISDNYLQCAARGNWPDRDGTNLPMRYRELRLLTDMMAGMTDGYAKSEYENLKRDGFL